MVVWGLVVWGPPAPLHLAKPLMHWWTRQVQPEMPPQAAPGAPYRIPPANSGDSTGKYLM